MKYTAKFIIKNSRYLDGKYCIANIYRDGDDIATIYWTTSGFKSFDFNGEVDGAIDTLLRMYTNFTKEVTTFDKQVMLLKAMFEFGFDMTENDIITEEEFKRGVSV